MKGRPNTPVVGFGPVARFAEELRAERAAASNPSYEAMGRQGNSSKSAMSTADSGEKLPTWEMTRSYLRACGVDDRTALDRWKTRWQAAQEAQRRLSPDLGPRKTLADLVAALSELMADQQVDLDGVRARVAQMPDPGEKGQQPYVKALPGNRAKPSAAEITASLRPGGDRLTRDTLGYVVCACGGIGENIVHWQKEWDRVNKSAPAAAPLLSEEMVQILATAPPAATPVPPRREWPAAAAVAAVLLLVGGFVAWSAASAQVPGHVARRASPAHLLVDPATPPIAALAELLDLRQRMLARPEAPPAGRYTYTHLKTWSVDATSDEADPPETITDERLWWTADRSGRRITTTTGPDGRTGPREVERYLPQELPVVVPAPSDDPATLRRELDAQQPRDTGAGGRLRAVADLSAFHVLGRAQRAAILEVLAYTERLTYRGLLPDRDGRVGIAISADTADRHGPTVRDTLVFDRETGALLGHETAVVGESTRPALKPVVLLDVVYVESGRTDQPG